MILEVNYEYPHSDWSPLHVFNGFFAELKKNNEGIEFRFINSAKFQDKNPCSFYSPHLMNLKNIENGKYITISYWDKAEELSYSKHGWDDKKRVQFITSSGVHSNLSFTPFTYLPYSKIFDEFTLQAKSMEDKERNELFFKGFLYGQRYNLSKTNMINITNNKTYPEKKYFYELTNNKICLSFNGAGEICNRDIEILSAKSVLFRPKLNQRFYDDLIPDYHYVTFEECSDPKEQCEIILKKFNEIKDNEELLKFVSENGYKWYLNNGTVDSNIKLLKNIIQLEKLF